MGGKCQFSDRKNPQPLKTFVYMHKFAHISKNFQDFDVTFPEKCLQSSIKIDALPFDNVMIEIKRKKLAEITIYIIAMK